jgi:hypothetical protein
MPKTGCIKIPQGAGPMVLKGASELTGCCAFMYVWVRGFLGILYQGCSWAAKKLENNS